MYLLIFIYIITNKVEGIVLLMFAFFFALVCSDINTALNSIKENLPDGCIW